MSQCANSFVLIIAKMGKQKLNAKDAKPNKENYKIWSKSNVQLLVRVENKKQIGLSRPHNIQFLINLRQAQPELSCTII